MSNRVLSYDAASGKAPWLGTEISPEGLKLLMQLGDRWISRTVSGPAIDAAYRAFDARDAEAFGELMFPTQPEAQEAAA